MISCFLMINDVANNGIFSVNSKNYLVTEIIAWVNDSKSTINICIS